MKRKRLSQAEKDIIGLEKELDGAWVDLRERISSGCTARCLSAYARGENCIALMSHQDVIRHIVVAALMKTALENARAELVDE